MLSRRREFAARGPLPPWWRRPGVLAVVGLLVTGGVLVASEGVSTLFAGRYVRDATATVRAMPLPGEMSRWGAACGTFGLRCAESDEPPVVAAQLVAESLREAGYDVDPVKCGAESQSSSISLLVGLPPVDSQCTATASLSGGALVVAAWDFLPPADGELSDGLPLGRTAVVVEWDAEGEDRLLRLEPGLIEARFGDVRLTPEELAALPGALADARCGGTDQDGCTFYEIVLDGPGERRAAVEVWAGRLLDAGFILTTVRCPAGDETQACFLFAEGGRDGGEQSRIGVTLSVDPDEPSQIRARVQSG